jgi:phosphocarrier protein
VSPKKQADETEATTMEREFTIRNKFGIHARPAALFVKTVSQFQSDVTVERDEMIASGKSIMGLLTLEGYQGAVLKVTARGPDAQEALQAIQELIDKKFYED